MYKMETIQEIVSIWESVKDKSDDELEIGMDKMKPLLNKLEKSSNTAIAKKATLILQYIEQGWLSVNYYEPMSEENEGIEFPFVGAISREINVLKGMSGGRRSKTMKRGKKSRKSRKSRKSLH